ncbi:tetratricopeptide repeat protein, partial [Methyloceanibacter sp.]|uniref:WD40 domain-containing protein n=1 Tax=Methyloceanibacter sp. TaxID=1965321 RepID=UPI003D6D7880
LTAFSHGAGKGRGIGGTRGLARVEPPSGTFIMFSAGAKESALDRLSDNDPSPNSVYTRTLLPRLKTSGRITDIARDVRREVRQLAASVAHVQTPAYYDEVVGDFCPAGCEAKAAALPVDAPAVPSSPPVETAAALTPQAVQGPASGHAPIHDCDRLAAHPDNPDSAIAAGVDFGKVDTARAIPACEEAVRAHPGERRFSFQLARAYVEAKKFELAKPLLETLSKDGYPIATTYLGFLYAGGNGVAKDEPEGLRLFRQAAEAGDALGAAALGTAYEWGQAVAKDEAEAARWYRKAADRGNVGSMLVLGDRYAEGKLGFAKDDGEAVKWFRKAADRGDAVGMYTLGLMYRDGHGVPKDQAEAAGLFAKGDAQKNASAMVEVGRKLENGLSVAEDDAEALTWFRKAADLGDQYGMFYLGLMHRYGLGVAKDSSEAARWYRKAAELGDVTSMRSLAELYEEGDGVAKDPAEALRWRRAAKEPASPSGAAPLDTKVALLRSFDPDEYEPVALAFSGDGARILALASGGYFRWLDVDGGGASPAFGASSCCQLVLSPSGEIAATGSYDEKAVRLWDLKKSELAADLKAHSDHVVAVSFSPDGKHLASGSYDGTVVLWDATSRELIRKFEPKTGKVYSVAFSPDGKVLASGHDEGDIKLWDVASGRLLQSLKADAFSVYSLIYTPDGGLLAARSGFAINLWDVAKASMVRSLKGAAAAISFSSMAMSPDGTEIVSGDGDGSIRVWDVSAGKQLQEIEAHAKSVSAVAYSPDGKTLASAGGDKTVKLWNLGSIKAAGR